jgi:hypothetical protein
MTNDFRRSSCGSGDPSKNRHHAPWRKTLRWFNCQGLNRSLKLPRVLAAKFGKPDTIYAPNPAVKILATTIGYNYIRPLATIEPTAIYYGMPVNVDFGFDKVGDLATELLKFEHHHKVIFVAWEHLFSVELARKIVAGLGVQQNIPVWPGSDFERLKRPLNQLPLCPPRIID